MLVQVVVQHDLRRARLAADALRGRADALSSLVAGLIACHESERARLLASLLRPLSTHVSAAQRRKLLDEAIQRLRAGDEGAKALIEVARETAPDKTAEALRKLYQTLRRQKPARATAVLRELCRSEQARDDDHFRLAVSLLGASAKDTRTRSGDESLELFEKLLRSGHDVVASLVKERSVDLQALYYLGFHLIEQDYPAGEDLLRQVMRKGGRKKIAKMARNKLRLAGHAP